MTSLAMIAGMVPMALGLGEGGDQTAPLGRAVIGGLAGLDVGHADVAAGRVRPGHGPQFDRIGLAVADRSRERYFVANLSRA